MTQKFSQITASIANFTTIDALIGVQSLTAGGGNDRLFSLPQIASAILTSPNITGHATIEGVTLTGVTGTGALVLDNAPTIGTATLTRPTLSTATINTATINNATLNTTTINTATINNATLNTAILNTATMETPTINSPTINNGFLLNPLLRDVIIQTGVFQDITINTATLNTATLNNPTLNTATINTATLNRVVINTATINNATLNTATLSTSTINNSTIGTAVINNSTLATAVINSSTINTSTLNTPTLNTATINTGTLNNVTLNTATINNSTLATAIINTATLNNVLVNPAAATTGFVLKSNGTLLAPTWAGGMVLLNTLTASQLGSAVDTTSLTSTYNRYRISFENVCPVATATLTCSLNMLVATSGVNWVSANYVSTLDHFVGGTTVIIGTTSLFYLSGTQATTCVGTSTIYGVNGFIEIVNPANAVFRKSINGELNYITPGAVSTLTHAQAFPSGFWDGAASAITGFAIAFQTGAISTGTFRVYGVS